MKIPSFEKVFFFALFSQEYWFQFDTNFGSKVTFSYLYGDHLELSLDKVVYGGKALAKTKDGKTVFVNRGLPQEEVLVQVTKEKSSYLEANILSVLKPAPYEKPSPCAFFRICGGCSYLTVPYDMQWEWKKTFVKDTMLRIGKLDISALNVLEFPAEEDLYYRHRIQLRGTIHENGHVQVGFLKSDSHDQVAIDGCSIAGRDLQPVISYISKMFLTESKSKTKFRLELQISPEMKRQFQPFILAVALEVESATDRFNTFLEYLKKEPSIACVKTKEQTLKQKDFFPFYTDEEENLTYFTLSGAFQQVYIKQNQSLKKLVQHWIKNDWKDVNGPILDIYAGSGNLSLALSKQTSVTAVESSSDSILIGKKNAAHNQLANINFVHKDVQDFLKTNDVYFPIVIADPARAGMKEAISYLKKMKPKKIIYVSCDLATAARDLNELRDLYAVEEMAILDFFPQTYHVETAFKLKILF